MDKQEMSELFEINNAFFDKCIPSYIAYIERETGRPLTYSEACYDLYRFNACELPIEECLERRVWEVNKYFDEWQSTLEETDTEREDEIERYLYEWQSKLEELPTEDEGEIERYCDEWQSMIEQPTTEDNVDIPPTV